MEEFMNRYFEKISFEQFKKDISDNMDLYKSYNIPCRETKYAAGYDFNSVESFKLKPGEIKKIPTGIKANMLDDEFLFLIVRSSMGFKYNVRLCNQIGVIDKDYYNNKDNEGHIWIKLQNEGDKDYVVNKGDLICQGIFIKYLTVDAEKNEYKSRKSDY
jgi:dUTP pyrophosphatase